MTPEQSCSSSGDHSAMWYNNNDSNKTADPAHTHQPPASQPSHPQSGPQLKAGRDHSDDDDDDQELVTSDQDPLTLLSSVIPWSPVLRS